MKQPRVRVTLGQFDVNRFRNAQRELTEAHNRILEMANSYQQALSDIREDPSSTSQQQALTKTQRLADQAVALVRDHTALQNAFNREIEKYRGIPGFETIFLNGFLGLVLLPIVYTVAATVGVAALAFALGPIANAFKAKYEALAAQHNPWGQFYRSYRDAQSSGQPLPPAPPEGVFGVSGDGGMWTWALIAGGVLAAGLLMKTLRG